MWLRVSSKDMSDVESDEDEDGQKAHVHHQPSWRTPEISNLIAHVDKLINEKEKQSCPRGWRGYGDSDWTSSTDRWGTTGYYFSLKQQGPPISWTSKKQHTIALPFCEALTAATQEAIFLKMEIVAIISQKRSIELLPLFVYPLSAVPLSLRQPDGTLNKTVKSNTEPLSTVEGRHALIFHEMTFVRQIYL